MAKIQSVFLRVENKYLLEEHQYTQLRQALDGRMCQDEYGRHTINNIYYDTPDWRLVRASIEKPLYKEKFRVRSYGTPLNDDKVFLEIKKKFDGVVYKRRATMTLKDARAFLGSKNRNPGSNQILREVDWMIKYYGIEPAAGLSYDRIALFGREDKDLRMTFDSDIRGRAEALDLSCGPFGVSILGDGKWLMEIKTTGALPIWMSRLLDELKIYPASFSKYGEYYKDQILGMDGFVYAKGAATCA